MEGFLQKTLVVLGLASTTLYGNYYDDCCCDPMGCGFLAGAYGSFHTFYFHAKDQAVDASKTNPEINQFEYDLIQRAPGGGGYIGYGMSFCDCYSVAFKAGVTGLASSAQFGWHDDQNNSDENYQNQLSVRYLVDLSFQLGTQVTECFMAYFNFGASYVDFKQTYSVINNDPPYEALNKFDRDLNEWGFVFGAGTQVALTQCINAFVQYDWHSYSISSATLDKIINDNPPGERSVRSQVTRLHSGGFTAGLAFSF